MTETAIVFDCEAERLVGIVTPAANPAATGVLIVVGGRQYRAGSHRQFLLLARRLARAGYSVFRFDVRGMGDSSGLPRSFEELDSDIGAAIETFQARCPAVTRIVIWGLCDAATAAVLYVHRAGDQRVAGLCLVNPWLRSDAGLARARVRHYYLKRLFSADFWRKLLQRRVGLLRALGEYINNLRMARQPMAQGFQRVMLDGLQAFPGPVLLLLSGQDLTAKEFVDSVGADAAGAEWLKQSRVRRVDIAGADHTFSRQSWRIAAEDAVLAWLKDQHSTFAARGRPLATAPGSATTAGNERIRLLFVCMANICRSPTAHAVVQAQLEKAGLAGRVDVASAGTRGHDNGTPPDKRARQAAARRGYDMSHLRTRRVLAADFAHFDHILAMDRDNLEALRRVCPPEHGHKLGLFLDYSQARAGGEVPDPYFGSDAGFEHVLDLIEEGAKGLVDSLRRSP